MATLSRWITVILLIVVSIILTIPTHAQSVIDADNASTVRLNQAIGYGYITSAQVSPLDGTIAVGTGNGLWLFDAGYVNPRQLHQGAVNDVAWRADGSELAGAFVDGMVRVWDSASAEARLTINAHLPAQPDQDQPTGATVVIWSVDHSQIISGGSDNMVHIWESRDGSSFFNLAGHTQPVTAVSVSLSGRLLSASASELFVWNTMRGQPEPIGAYHSIAAWSGDGRYILTQEGENIAVLDGDTFNLINTFPQTSERLHVDWATRQGTAFTVIGTEAPAVLILDAWLNVERGRLGEGRAEVIAWENNEVDLAVWQDGALTVWSTLDGTPQYTLGGWNADARSLVWLDQNRVALIDESGTSTVWDIAQSAVIPTASSHSSPSGIQPLSHEEAALTANAIAQALRGELPTSITAQIAVSDQGNVLSIFDGQGGLLGQYPTPFEQSITDHGIAEIVANPARDVIAGGVSYVNTIGDTVHAVELWNVQTGAQLAQLSDHNAPVIVLAFSPDGTALATLDINGVAYLWTVN